MEKIALTAKERKEIEQLIEKVFSLLEIEGTFALEEQEDILEVMMETKDTGIVIGYHGEVLESLQLILSLAIAKKLGRFVRVSIEVDGYKKNRTEYLHNLAMQVKEKALSENKEQVLSALKSWERRIIHLYLQNDEQVTSESEGEGKERVLGSDHVPADGIPVGFHGRSRGLHCVRGAQRTANSGAVREARGGTQGDGRAVNSFAATSECRRGYASDFRVIDLDAAADDRLRDAEQSLFRGSVPDAGVGGAALHPPVCRRHHFLRLLLCVDRVQPRRGLREHAEVWRVHSRYPAWQENVGLHQ